ncbi:RES domain-containing protein, partial [Ruminococcaceae bacterium OttesenSCG-928-O06]|nr:RES domain-containing protein [Ruminococcaceae bacterium OttesenSCG-928-O06]
MGLIKEYASRGYGSSDTVVCHGCATDYALQNFIKENGHLATCDYCGSRRKCIGLEELMEPIMNGIRFEYTDAANELAYEGREGGYQGTVYDSDELIKDVLYKELGIEDDRLLDDISSLMDDVAWCERDYYWGREEDNAYYTWEDFCTLVKTKVRYVFYKVSDDLLTGSEPQPSEILEIIGSYVRKSNLIKELNGKTTKLYRARTHKDEGGLKGAHEYFPPLPKQTKPYRMNPEGIPMLYLTYKPETAVREVYSKKAKYASVARYKLLRNFRVVDFTKPTNVQFPSLFDDERRGRRAAMAFLRRFSEDISKPDARNKAV